MARAPNKPLVWLKGEVKTPPFSAEARIEAGVLAAQIAERRKSWSCHELRINDENQTWRIIYYIAGDALVILEVFSEKTAATPDEVLMNCKRRLRAYFSVGAGEEGKRK